MRNLSRKELQDFPALFVLTEGLWDPGDPAFTDMAQEGVDRRGPWTRRAMHAISPPFHRADVSTLKHLPFVRHDRKMLSIPSPLQRMDLFHLFQSTEKRHHSALSIRRRSR